MKGVVLTHASLIDRARVTAATEGLTDADVAIAYLSPGWIGQTLFSYVQPMVTGYCVCCPESSESMLADMRAILPDEVLAGIEARYLGSATEPVESRRMRR